MNLKSTCVAILALALLCSPGAEAIIDPIKDTIDKAVAEALQKIISGAATVTSTVGTVAQPISILGQQMVNDYKAMGQTVVQAGQALGQQMLSSLGNTGAQLGAFTDQIGTLTEAYESQFCTPAVFIPAVKTPATLYGPAFDIILDSGSCELNEEALLHEHRKELKCFKPTVTFVKFPANFTSKHKSAPEFIAKSCKVEKVFGEEERKVLYVFDGSNPVDVGTLTTTITNEIRQALGMVTGSAHNLLSTQLQNFMTSMASIPNLFNLNSGTKLMG